MPRGYKRFLRRAWLEKSDYLRDDCLKIYCTIGAVDFSIDYSRLRSIQVPDSDIGTHISMLLENMEGSDITFNVSGEKLHAHKLILAARSPKLLSDLLEGVDAKEVVVPDMEPQVFKALLHFIYRDDFPENELISSSSCSAPLVADTLTAKLLAAADHYNLDRLKRICESHMCKNISVNSVTQVLDLAGRCHAAELEVACLEFAAENVAGFCGEAQLSVNASSSKSGATPPASSKSVAAPPTGPVTEDEIKAFLLQRTPLTTRDLVDKFKFRLKLKENGAASGVATGVLAAVVRPWVIHDRRGCKN